MKLVKDYENVMQKIVTLFNKLFTINVDTDQKKKSERFSKLSTTVFKSLTIIDDSSTVVASFSIFSNTFSSESSTNTFSLVSAEQKLAIVIFFKQVFIDSIPSAVARKFLVLK